MVVNGKIIASLNGMTILHNGKAQVIGSLISDVKVKDSESSTIYDLCVFKLFDKTNFDIFIFDQSSGKMVNYVIGKQTPSLYQKLYQKSILQGVTLQEFLEDFTFEYINFKMTNF